MPECSRTTRSAPRAARTRSTTPPPADTHHTRARSTPAQARGSTRTTSRCGAASRPVSRRRLRRRQRVLERHVHGRRDFRRRHASTRRNANEPARRRKRFAVVGSRSGYVHPIVADAGGNCIVDPTANRLQVGRIPLRAPACDPTRIRSPASTRNGTFDRTRAS